MTVGWANWIVGLGRRAKCLGWTGGSDRTAGMDEWTERSG